ncbi:MAG: mucoidy inhibitor MuiA family protein [Candidatus Thorarchaeota archaeon]|nr:mucoidy inhibitor MuiA family protein [Candidatus Thorarchaeota archaeon]
MSKEMKTKIANVTVFRDGARVTRIGSTELVAGEQTVLIDGISQYAQNDSFRVKGRGAALLKGIDVSTKSATFEPEGNLKELLAKLEELEKQRGQVEDKIEYQQSRLTSLNAILGQFSGEFGKWFAAGESSLEQLEEMDGASSKIALDAKKKLRALQEEIDGVNSEIQAVQNNISRVRGERRVETTTLVKVLLDVKESTKIELDVTYQLGGAGWTPTYDVDIGDEKSAVKRIAMVSNQTLEDWKDVGLVVSTSSARPVEAVKSSPFYVDIMSAYPTTGAFGTGIEGMADARAYDRDEEPEAFEMAEDAYEPEPIMEQSYATASETLSGTVIYEVPGKITLFSGEEPQPVTLTEEAFDSRRLYYWNAYAMPEVVAQDEITNGDSVILPGSVKVFAAGDFLGETSVHLIAPREKFRLGTRIAYDVKAEKKLVEKDTEKAGLVGGKRKRGYKYRLELSSYAKKPVNVRVVDRIPHSNSEKIKVELKPPAISYKKMELGVIEWELAIEPQKKVEVEYEFEVSWEKDVTISPPLP